MNNCSLALVALLAQAPQRVAGQAADVVQPRQRRHQRLGTSGDDDAACAERVLAAIGETHAHLPRVDDLRLALQHLDAERAVAFDRIVRFDLLNDARHAPHDVSEG